MYERQTGVDHGGELPRGRRRSLFRADPGAELDAGSASVAPLRTLTGLSLLLSQGGFDGGRVSASMVPRRQLAGA